MAKVAAFGITVEQGDADTVAGVTTWTTIGQITNVASSGTSAETIDVTTHDSSNAWREFIAGLLDAGDLSISFIYDPGLASQTAVRTQLDGRLIRAYKVTFPDSGDTEMTFIAVCTNMSWDADVAGALAGAASFKISGPVAFA